MEHYGPAALTPGIGRHTHLIRRWVGPGTGLDDSGGQYAIAPTRNRIPECPALA